MDRTLDLVDLLGDPITALLSLPGEELGDRTGNRRPSDLTDTAVIQFYEARCPAEPLGKLLVSAAPETLERVSADLSLNGPNIISLAEAKRVLRWVRDEEHRAESYLHYHPEPHHRARPSALAERQILAAAV